jgi:hypothetical protein
MTQIPAFPRDDQRLVTVRSPAGQGIVSLEPIPAVAALTAALAIAPRFTALAAIGALIARMSITIDDRIVRPARRVDDQPVARAS